METGLTQILSDTKLLWTAIVSAVTSAAVSYFFNRWQTRDKLRIEYEHEERKRVRELIGRFHGRLLLASVHMNHRMWNLYKNHDRGWLCSLGSYEVLGYYFLSTVHRFLCVCSLCRRLEREAIYLDARIAGKDDLTFLKITSAISWVMTDVSLFAGLTYDHSKARDHFFSDHLRKVCDSCYEDDHPIHYDTLEERIAEDRSLDRIMAFFDGLTQGEERYRWDRMVALHLLVVAFINKFGYPEQRSTTAQISEIVEQFRNPEIASNLIDWMPRLGLGKVREFREVRDALRRYLRLRKSERTLVAVSP